MKVKTSCEIATIAALVHFGKNPEAGLAWIEEIYNAARRETGAHIVPVNLGPIVDAAIDVGQEVERQKQATKKPRKSRKAAESQGGGKKPGKRAVIPGRRGPNRIELKRTEDARTMDERMEEAYLGEHPKIEPEEKPVEKQPLTPAEKRLYDYIVAHPDHTKPQIQEALLMSQTNYYLLKGNIRRKGWIDDNGAIGFEVKVLDNVNLTTKPGENE